MPSKLARPPQKSSAVSSPAVTRPVASSTSAASSSSTSPSLQRPTATAQPASSTEDVNQPSYELSASWTSAAVSLNRPLTSPSFLQKDASELTPHPRGSQPLRAGRHLPLRLLRALDTHLPQPPRHHLRLDRAMAEGVARPCRPLVWSRRRRPVELSRSSSLRHRFRSRLYV